MESIPASKQDMLLRNRNWEGDVSHRVGHLKLLHLWLLKSETQDFLIFIPWPQTPGTVTHPSLKGYLLVCNPNMHSGANNRIVTSPKI